MLDLQAGVHLEEEEVALIVGHELDGSRAGVADRGRREPGGLEQLVPHARNTFDQWRRRLFDDLLVAALDRALAFADRPHGAVRVGHHLDFDVVPGVEVALAEHRGITERRLGLAAGGSHLRGQLGEIADHPHPPSATACGRLDQHRQHLGGHGVRIEFVEHRHAGGGHDLLGLDLGPHRRTAATGGPTQVRPASWTAAANSAFSERNP